MMKIHPTEIEIGNALDELLEQFDGGEVSTTDVCNRVLGLKSIALAQTQTYWPRKDYWVGYLDGLMRMFGTMVPLLSAMDQFEIEAKAGQMSPQEFVVALEALIEDHREHL
ncbi:hypothetical protein [Thiomonas intermedia]|uniref:hypothetical protein n=1 Tax=Thiomonas intermedia TaxID=926 RepID=UPI0009A4BCFF|nr:hypothetical protein [Thiomonas intermedia]